MIEYIGWCGFVETVTGGCTKLITHVKMVHDPEDFGFMLLVGCMCSRSGLNSGLNPDKTTGLQLLEM